MVFPVYFAIFDANTGITHAPCRLKLIPGVDVNKTPALNEMAISDCQLIRFVPDRNGIGLVQKLGGWQKWYPNNYPSTIVSLHAWQDNLSVQHLGVGMVGVGPFNITGITGDGATVTVTYASTETLSINQEIELTGVLPSDYNGHYTVTAIGVGTVSFASTTVTAYVGGGLLYGGGLSLAVITDGSSRDVSPQIFVDNVPVKFETVAGSNVVTITDSGSNIDEYDIVYIETEVSVGGIVIKGTYRCLPVGVNTFRIEVVDVFGNPLPALISTVISPLTVTNATGTGTVATLTYVNAYTFLAGDAVTVSGVNPSGYDGSYVLTAATAGGTISYNSSEIGAFVSGGTISNYGVVSKFTTLSGSPNVTVTLPSHGYNVGDTATYLVSTTVGGITIYGDYTVTEVLSDSEYVIVGQNQASAYASAYINNGEVRLKFYNGIGPLPPGTGYGVGPYGAGAYGSGIPPIQKLGVPINTKIGRWTIGANISSRTH